MMRFIRTFVAVAAVGAVFGLWLTSASAHTGTLSASCEGVTGTLANFPQGTQEVTINVDGDETDLEFQGPAGSVFLPWDFTAGGDHAIGLSWSAGGGGTVSIGFNSDDCVPPPTTVPPTTVPPQDCFDPYDPDCFPPPTTEPPVVDCADTGEPPPCDDPDDPMPPPAGPVEGSPRSTG